MISNKPGLIVGLTIVGLTLLFAWSFFTPSTNKNIDLLSTPRTSYKILNTSDFNVRLSTESGSNWVNDPIIASYYFIGGSFGKNQIITVENTDTGYNVVAIYDYFSGDSIRGSRYDLKFDDSSDDYLQISSAQKSWRCKDGRGHSDYSNELCL